MKKMLLLTAMTVMTFAGCVKNEVHRLDSENHGPKIVFESPFMYDNVTKAEVFGELNEAKYPQDENFIIFAAQHQGDFKGWPTKELTDPLSEEDGLCAFNGKEISYVSTFDAWAPTYLNDESKTEYYYWPQGKKLSFAAMSPSDLGDGNNSALVGYDDTGLTITNYVNPEPGKQFDLLFAKRTMNHTSSDMIGVAGVYSGIPISFQHALSSIHFSICKDEFDQDVKLKKITLKGVINKGTFEEKIDESKGLSYVIDETSGNTVTPSWTVSADTTHYISFDGNGKTIDFPLTAQYVSSVVDNMVKDEILSEGDVFSTSLLVIPQELTDETVLVIEYLINDSPQTKVCKLKDLETITDGGILDADKHGTISAWERGYKYSYRIHYSTTSHKKDVIYFSPSVEGWKDVQIIQITL